MVLKTTSSFKSKLRSWFFNEPAKFAGLSFGLLAVLTLIYAFLRTLIYGDAPMSPLPVALLLCVILVFAVYRLIKKLPKDNLDRRSFIAVNNGLTLIYFLSFFLSTILLITSAQQIMYYMMWLQYYSITLFFITMTIASLAYLYVLGLLVANIYAVYRRALAMGVPKWKVLLSFPFSFLLLWMPAYLLPEKTTEKPVILIKSKWYSSLTDWIVRRPINSILFVLLMLVFAGLVLNVYISCLWIFFAVVFGVWVWIKGIDSFRKSISGAFTSFTASLNVALIITSIVLASMGYTQSKNDVRPIDAVQVIQTAESAGSVN